MVKIERCGFGSRATNTSDLLPNGADPAEDLEKTWKMQIYSRPKRLFA